MITLKLSQARELMESEVGAPFSPTSLLGEDARYMGDDLETQYMAALANAIGAPSEWLLDAVSEAVDEEPAIERVGAELLLHCGIHPLIANALLIEVGGQAVFEDEIGWRASVSDVGVQAFLGEGVVYAHGRIKTKLPETVVTAAIGRPLREVVSHAVLERHDIVVTGSSRDGDLDLDLDYDALDAAALRALASQGSEGQGEDPA